MDKCEDHFYYACRNAQIKCRICAAGNGTKSKKVFFVPVEGKESLSPHPVETQLEAEKKLEKLEKLHEAKERRRSERFKKKQKVVKKALQMEKEVANRLNKKVRNQQNLLTQTIASGSVFGDGDIKSDVANLQLDHKYRSLSESFSLSRREYEKGINQNTNGWIITSGITPESLRTVIVLTEESFTKLLALASRASQDNGSEISSKSL